MNYCLARISLGGDTCLPKTPEGLQSGIDVIGGYIENYRNLEFWFNLRWVKHKNYGNN
jgi:hypothetical protein